MPKKKKTDLLKLLESHVDETSELAWEGTLADYIKLVSKNPEIHMSSHTRVLRMIESFGMEKDDEGNVTNYKFFENDLFGISESISEIMSYLKLPQQAQRFPAEFYCCLDQLLPENLSWQFF